jgi:hypothetical protein
MSKNSTNDLYVCREFNNELNHNSITLDGQTDLECFVVTPGSKQYNSNIIITGDFIMSESSGHHEIKTSLQGYNLKSVTIKGTVTLIGNSVFSGCKKMERVSMESPVVVIGGGTFGGCSNLTHVKMSDEMWSIGDYSFSGCSNLESITFPSNVGFIGTKAFKDCIKLTEVTINSNIKMKINVFENTRITTIILSDTLKDIDNDMFVDNGLNYLKKIEYLGKNIYNKENFDLITKKIIRSLKEIKTDIEDEKERSQALKKRITKKQLTWIIPVAFVSGALLLFIVFKVTRRRPIKQNTKNTKNKKKSIRNNSKK